MIVPPLLGGRYEVGPLIGRGGMADVYRGHDTRLDRVVAIKLLRSDLARDGNFLIRFRREAQAAGGLADSAIVAIYDSGEEATTDDRGEPARLPYIVMEYVDGETLRATLTREEVIPAPEAARIMMGVLTALAYSHRMGIVHRDIKPANVMLTVTGDVKVMDFGIARAVADTSATMTQTQAVIGTAQYLSPEQAQGLPVDARSDLYSAGCMLAELLTGRPPFTGDSPVSVAYQHVGEQPAAPSTYNPAVPHAYDLVVLHALVKDRDRRYQSATEFRNDLAAARDGRPLSAAALAGDPADVATTRLAGPRPAGGTATGTGTAGLADPADPAGPATGSLDAVAEDEHEEKRRGWLYALLALVGVLVLVGVFFGARSMFATDPASQLVSVPKVVGLQLEAAKAALSARNLAPQVNNVTDNTAPKGQVVRQSPTDGATVNPGSTVVIDVSSGPGAAALPNVVGFSQDAAITALKAAGFQVSTIQQVDDNTQAAGNVVSTDPPANTVTPLTTPVTLRVATGKVAVPPVTGKALADAQTDLLKAGLTVKVTQVDDGAVAEGTVLKQAPESGAIVDVGSAVELTVARQPAVTTTATATTTITVTPTRPPATTTTSRPPTTTTTTTPTATPSATATGTTAPTP